MKQIFALNSLKKKFVLVVMGLLFGVFLIGGVVSILNTVSETRANLTGEAIAFAKLSTKPISETYDLYFNSGYYKFREVFESIAVLDKNIEKIQIIDVNGQIIFDSSKMKEDTYDSNEVESADQSTLEKVINSEPVYVANLKNNQEITEIYYPYYTDWGSHPYTLRYFVSYKEIQEKVITIILQNILMFFLFFALALLLITSVVNKLILHPITTVSQIAQRISLGKYGERIQINTNDETENLADAVSIMARTLEQNIVDLKELDKLKGEFIDIAAHNFRTPVTHIRFDLDYLKNKVSAKISPKELDVLKDIEVSNENLTLLIDDLLNITSLEKGKMKLVKFQPFDLKETVKEAADIYGQDAKKKNITFKTNLPKILQAEVLGDPPKIREVIGNLLDNAFKFTHKGGKVWLELKEVAKEYIVTVKDTGIGISREELPKLFQKFHRATDILTYDYEGRGLGLYVSKLIVEAHNGRIFAESEEGKGSSFKFALPKNLPDSPLPQHVAMDN